MTKLFEKNSLCAYCAQPAEAPEVEHVFPESWYPDGTPQSAMLKVPSHRHCNGQLGAVEERLLRHFAMGLHPSNRTALGVQQRVFRSMNPNEAKGRTEAARLREATVRANLWKKFKKTTRVVPADEDCGAMPVTTPYGPYMLQNEAGLWIRGKGLTRFDPNDLEQITDKFVRGIFYYRTGIPLSPDTPVRTPIISEDPWEKLLTILNYVDWHPHVVSPAFMYWGDAVTESQSSLWFFLLWNTYVLCGATGQALVQELDGGVTPSLEKCL